MYRSGVFFLFLLMITFLFSQTKNDQSASYLKEYELYDKIYRDAGRLSFRPDYNDKIEEQEKNMNRQALNGFSKILPAIEKDRNDSLAFHCYFKIGTLDHYFDSLAIAHQFYLKAIALKNRL